MFKKIALKLFEGVNWIVAHSPAFINRILSFKIYLFLYYIFRYRRKVVAMNLSNSFPEKPNQELNAIEKQYYKQLSRLFRYT
ncbi:MAG: hypothetical protein HYZ42_11210 [Bacteroidetes bacterium]|nr:hypothetical protein [Bacteroidota bacterium]